jgi:hypothetical protein
LAIPNSYDAVPRHDGSPARAVGKAQAVHYFRAPLAAIKSAGQAKLHTAEQTALHATLDLRECAGRQRHDCGSEQPFAQQKSSHCDPIRTLGDATANLRDTPTARSTFFDVFVSKGHAINQLLNGLRVWTMKKNPSVDGFKHWYEQCGCCRTHHWSRPCTLDSALSR